MGNFYPLQIQNKKDDFYLILITGIMIIFFNTNRVPTNIKTVSTAVFPVLEQFKMSCSGRSQKDLKTY
jgi:hypothetical protein